MEFHAAFDAKIEHLREMLSWILFHLKDCEKKTQLHAELASEEAIVNIILHAYKDKVGKIDLRIKKDEKAFEIHFEDQGPAFNPLDVNINTEASLEERDVGGLGVHLIKKCMDEVRYERAGNRNCLVMKKHG